jgi:hypothetical protein
MKLGEFADLKAQLDFAREEMKDWSEFIRNHTEKTSQAEKEADYKHHTYWENMVETLWEKLIDYFSDRYI